MAVLIIDLLKVINIQINKRELRRGGLRRPIVQNARDFLEFSLIKNPRQKIIIRLKLVLLEQKAGIGFVFNNIQRQHSAQDGNEPIINEGPGRLFGHKKQQRQGENNI